MSCIKKTRGLFQTGNGIREKAKGPANGGLVASLCVIGGPISGRNVGTPSGEPVILPSNIPGFSASPFSYNKQ